MGLIQILKRLMHGGSRHRSGASVTVTRPIDGMHLVDRGMLSTTVSVPLAPGDKLEFRGPHLGKENVVRIPEADSAKYLARIAEPGDRTLIDTTAFYVYLPVDEQLRANDG